MAKVVNILQATTNLSRIVGYVAAGNEVIIARAGSWPAISRPSNRSSAPRSSAHSKASGRLQ